MKRTCATIALVVALTAPAGGQTCAGDCNGDGEVTVDEIILAVNIALGSAAVTECQRADAGGDGQVTVDEIVAAGDAALNGCVAQSLAFVVATDFETGSFGTVGLDEPRAVTPITSQRVVHSDAVARSFGGLVYIINRFFGDTIQVLDPANDFATRVQCLTGEFSNPQDIAFLSNEKAYVSLGGGTDVLIVDPTPALDCSDFIRGRIDLASFADDDGFPEMHHMAIVGSRLFVTLQKLDQTNFFVPAENGSIVAIDTTTDTVIDEIVLSAGNPFAQGRGLTVRDGMILVSQTGFFGSLDGGIERVDPTTLEAAGLFITEADLGGDLTDFVILSDDLGYAILSLPDFTNSVVAFDPSRRVVTQTLFSGSAFVSDIELNDRGQLFAADRTAQAPGIRIFDTGSNTELTTAPINLGLPPFDILFLP